MKILYIPFLLLIFSCKSENKNIIPYVEITTNKNIGEEIQIETTFSENDSVWLDLNNNKLIDKGERLTNPKFYTHYDHKQRHYIGYSRKEQKFKLQSKKFRIYGKAKHLYCSGNEVTKIDITKNIYLEELFCGSNLLQELNTKENKYLKILNCSHNSITELNLSNNKNLEFLDIIENDISKINLSKNTKLEVLRIVNWNSDRKSSMSTNVYNYEKGWNEILKTLEEQKMYNLNNWHITAVYDNVNLTEYETKDLILIMEENIPYSQIKDYNAIQEKSKMLVFDRHISNYWKKIGEYNIGYVEYIDVPEIMTIHKINDIDEMTYEKTIYKIDDNGIFQEGKPRIGYW